MAFRNRFAALTAQGRRRRNSGAAGVREMRGTFLFLAVALAGCNVSIGEQAKAPDGEQKALEDGQKVDARNPQSVVAALQAKGYQAQLGMTGGEPAIDSGAGGVKFKIFFENCTDGKDCTTVSFLTGFTDLDTTLDVVNEFNRTSRFAHAYIDKEDDPVLRMDVDLDHGGIPQPNFEEYLAVWSSLTPKFLNFVRRR
jgi:hypothetical protein